MNLLTKTESGVISNISNDFSFEELANDQDVINESYEVVYGKLPESYDEAVLLIENDHEIDESVLTNLGINIDEYIEYDDIVGQTIVVAQNDDYYAYNDMMGVYQVNSDLGHVYDNGIKVTITGILKNSTDTNFDSTGVRYYTELTDKVFENTKGSEIVKAQEESEVNVLTGMKFNEYSTKNDALKSLGGLTAPISINIYSKNYDSKEEIKNYLDNWNESAENEIVYSDLSEEIASSMTSFIDMIQTVLVVFASISLVVSSIMIGIITYVSVLERTKEIGILRSLGASKRDIKNVFNAETIIVGLVAGTLGIGLSLLLSFPINMILENIIGFNNIMQVELIESLGLIGISVLLTLVAGLIPSSMAAKKDPVEALRME